MTKIHNMLGRRNVKADLGIEIEVESNEELPESVTYWEAKRDGSLRGNSMEYVTKPIKLGEVDEAMAKLRSSFDDFNAHVKYSFRAGVHVHVNCMSLELDELIQFVMTYLILEIPLVDYCGTDRVGNAFCLRTVDAEGGLDHFIKCLRIHGDSAIHGLDTDNIRYGSINFKALADYGTVEFRCMATHENFERTDEWAKMLVGLREFARQFTSPIDLLTQFKEMGMEGFCQSALGEYYSHIFPNDMNKAEIYEGLHYAQDLAYYRY